MRNSLIAATCLLIAVCISGCDENAYTEYTPPSAASAPDPVVSRAPLTDVPDTASDVPDMPSNPKKEEDQGSSKAIEKDNYANVYPGMEITIIERDDSNERNICTLGFILPTKPRPMGVTSGHCGEEGSLVYGKIKGKTQRIGRIVSSQVHNSDDWASIEFSDDVATTYKLYKSAEPTAISSGSDLQEGDELCKAGAVTGVTCGKVLKVTKNAVAFDAGSDEGDSGSPVYRVVDEEGNIEAVGTFYGSPSDNEDIALATLLGPLADSEGLPTQ